MVGMVVFNNEVVIIGDGMNETGHIAGDNLNKYDEIKQYSDQIYGNTIKTPISQSLDSLISKIEKLEEKG